MIFVANVLIMNGGSTFLVRTAREMKRQDLPIAVLILRKEVDEELLIELEKSATVFYLEDFLLDKGILFRAHLGALGPISWGRLFRALMPYGNHIHAMGVFGLIFGYRLCAARDRFRISVGVYHQNEFLYANLDSFFARKSSEIFRSLPEDNVVFYNETTRYNYIKFFVKEFKNSLIIPIGIDLPKDNNILFNTNSYRVVSIGNLVEFKTYNEDVIRVLPSLLKKYPSIKYVIYGKGSNEHFLKSLVVELGLNDVVKFNGEVEYTKISSALKNSALFVGSGTALIEAAALGIPALIGIESIKSSETYGFLSDVEGYSYNEDVSYIKKKSFAKLLENFFENSSMRNELSKKCHMKAKIFAVEKTVAGLINLKVRDLEFKNYFTIMGVLKMFFSLLILGLRERYLKANRFSDRRNQSY